MFVDHGWMSSFSEAEWLLVGEQFINQPYKATFSEPEVGIQFIYYFPPPFKSMMLLFGLGKLFYGMSYYHTHSQRERNIANAS